MRIVFYHHLLVRLHVTFVFSHLYVEILQRQKEYSTDCINVSPFPQFCRELETKKIADPRNITRIRDFLFRDKYEVSRPHLRNFIFTQIPYYSITHLLFDVVTRFPGYAVPQLRSSPITQFFRGNTNTCRSRGRF